MKTNLKLVESSQPLWFEIVNSSNTFSNSAVDFSIIIIKTILIKLGRQYIGPMYAYV